MAVQIRLHNTLTRSKDVFVPIDPKNVRLYVCGPTVYDYAHIGNARPIIVFDLLFRLLRHVYGEEAVTYVRNITDVDDKINARAVRDFPDLPHNEAIRLVTQKTEEQFHADIRALGVLMPEDVNKEGQHPCFVEPRATEHIDEMRMIIERLIERGAAYVAEEHVLFSVAAMQKLSGVPQYGAFSKRSLDELLSGARVDVAPYKRDPMDFVLWKPSGPQDPAWPSPAGIETPGRPGWHIECSAMSWKHLVQAFETRLTCTDPTAREIFDIHGGGIDLVFPHHENEIAQSCCAFGLPRMANVWMHNGFLQVEGEKMSKSLGNFFTIHELLETDTFGGRSWSGEVLRIAMLRTHYRQPIDWTVQGLQESFKAWISFGNVVREHMNATTPDDAFLAALADDLNTPAAFARLFELRDAAVKGDQESGRALTASLRMMGFFQNAFGVRIQLSYMISPEGLSPDSMVPNVLGLSGDFELNQIAEHLETREPDLAKDTVVFLKKFSAGTTVRDLKEVAQKLAKQGKLPSDLLRLDKSRKEARAAKNWAESDRIRDELAAMSVVVKDNKDGTTTWEVAR
ncbi:cysteine--tRNA ligase [Microvirga roseola]|uniref:cysteine--tRNA ligase n=1 Tax=Microvirga roseola TaxID=2883126 RepID=UPI001E4CB38C|nr:cysteine--tRNA ligase [Microvirga roseola]